MILLAIDPGKDAGWALFRHSRLVSCGLARPDDWAWIVDLPALDHVLIELPEVYSARQSKGPAGDLVTLGFRAGRMIGQIDARGGAPTLETVKPAAWKSQLPKEVCALRAEEALALEERLVATLACASVASGKGHNVWDAIALGLWRLRRVRLGPPPSK